MNEPPAGPDAAELLADVDTALTDLEHARQTVRLAIEARTAALHRYRTAVDRFDAWSKQALT